ncbi:MAG: thioredoxin family protein [Myxococcota bacterium]
MTYEDFQDQLEASRLTVAYFTGPNCSVCHAIEPKLDAMMLEFDTWAVVKVNTEQSREVAGQSLVMAVPTLLFFVEGREVDRLSRSFSMAQVRQRLEHYTASRRA